jgi:hypothetical protein
MTTIKFELLDELLAGISSFEDGTGEAGLFMQHAGGCSGNFLRHPLRDA